MMILDQTGKKMKALDVLTAAIKHMKQFLLDQLKTRGAKRKLADNEITWMITVPAIWNNAAKQIMRRAAEKVSGYFYFFHSLHNLIVNLINHLSYNLLYINFFRQAGCLHWATQIALEPEAASIYCQNQPNVYFEELLKNENTKYLVVDIGGN